MMWKFQKWGVFAKVVVTFVALAYFGSIINPDKEKQQNQIGSASTPSTTSESAALEPAEDVSSNVAQEQPSKPLLEEENNQEPEQSNISVQQIKGVGEREVGVVDDVHYTVLNSEKVSTIGNEFIKETADGVFVILRVVAHNTDKETHDVTTMLMKLTDDQGREFDSSSKGNIALVGTGDKTAEPFSAQMQPGITKTFSIVYDIPADATGLKLKIPAGMFSGSDDAVIKVP